MDEIGSKILDGTFVTALGFRGILLNSISKELALPNLLEPKSPPEADPVENLPVLSKSGPFDGSGDVPGNPLSMSPLTGVLGPLQEPGAFGEGAGKRELL
jgi:hypothetical protein